MAVLDGLEWYDVCMKAHQTEKDKGVGLKFEDAKKAVKILIDDRSGRISREQNDKGFHPALSDLSKLPD